MKGEFLCVVCPNGCTIDAEFTDKKPPKLIAAEGQRCQRGLDWVTQEIEKPMRTIASSVLVRNGDFLTASVRTDKPIPLDKVMKVVEEIRALCLDAPLRSGEVVIEQPLGVDTNIIVTRSVKRKTA